MQVPGSFSDQEWVQAFVLSNCVAPVRFDDLEVAEVRFMPLHEVRCYVEVRVASCGIARHLHAGWAALMQVQYCCIRDRALLRKCAARLYQVLGCLQLFEDAHKRPQLYTPWLHEQLGFLKPQQQSLLPPLVAASQRAHAKPS